MLPDDTGEAVARILKKKQETLETRYGNYSDNLNVVDRTLRSIMACFELNGGTIGEIAFPLLDVFKAIGNRDHKLLDSTIQLLRNESTRLPEHIRLSVDAQIELLNACPQNAINYGREAGWDKK
jgi:hypothetical protein